MEKLNEEEFLDKFKLIISDGYYQQEYDWANACDAPIDYINNLSKEIKSSVINLISEYYKNNTFLQPTTKKIIRESLKNSMYEKYKNEIFAIIEEIERKNIKENIKKRLSSYDYTGELSKQVETSIEIAIESFYKNSESEAASAEEHQEQILKDIISNFLILNDDTIADLMALTPGLALELSTKIGTFSITLGTVSDGKTSKKIDNQTYFDIASITKAISLLTIFDLMKENNFSLDDKIEDIYKIFNRESEISNPDLKNLTLREFLSFAVEFKTDGRFELSKDPQTITRTIIKREKNDSTIESVQEIIKKYNINLLETATANNPGKFKYSDIPYMLLSYIIPGFHQEVIKFLERKGLDSKIKSTENISADDVITGGMLEDIKLSQPNDPKRTLTVFCKHPKGLEVTEVPELASSNGIAIEGFTGVWSFCDPKLNVTATIFTNPLSQQKGKPEKYAWKLDKLKRLLMQISVAFDTVRELSDSVKNIPIRFNYDLVSELTKNKKENIDDSMIEKLRLYRNELTFEEMDQFETEEELYNYIISRVIKDSYTMYEETSESKKR